MREPRVSPGAFVGLEHVTPKLHCNRHIPACSFLEALEGIQGDQKETAPQRSCFRIEHTRMKSLPLNLEDGGRVGRCLGAMTGRRCSALKMGRKQSAQSLGLAGM